MDYTHNRRRFQNFFVYPPGGESVKMCLSGHVIHSFIFCNVSRRDLVEYIGLTCSLAVNCVRAFRIREDRNETFSKGINIDRNGSGSFLWFGR